MRLPLADIIDHPWWKAHKVPDSVYKAFGRSNLGRVRWFLFRCGKARWMRRRRAIIRLGFGHPGPLRLCLAGRLWCVEQRKGRGSFGARTYGFTNRRTHVPDSRRMHPGPVSFPSPESRVPFPSPFPFQLYLSACPTLILSKCLYQ